MKVILLANPNEIPHGLLDALQRNPGITNVFLGALDNPSDAYANRAKQSAGEQTVVICAATHDTSLETVERIEAMETSNGYQILCLVSDAELLAEYYSRNMSSNTLKPICWDTTDLENANDILFSALENVAEPSKIESRWERAKAILLQTPVVVAFITTVVGSLGVVVITEIYNVSAAHKQMAFEAIQTLMQLTTQASTEDLEEIHKLNALVKLVESNKGFSSIDTKSYQAVIDDLYVRVQEKQRKGLEEARRNKESDVEIERQVKELEETRASVRRAQTSQTKLQQEFQALQDTHADLELQHKDAAEEVLRLSKDLDTALASNATLKSEGDVLEAANTTLNEMIEKSLRVVTSEVVVLESNQSGSVGEFVVFLDNVGALKDNVDLRFDRGGALQFGKENIDVGFVFGRIFDSELLLIKPLSVERNPEQAILEVRVLDASNW